MLNFKHLALSAAMALSLTSTASAEEVETNYEEKLPYLIGEQYWEKYTHGDTGPWPLPKVSPHGTGIYSLASLNSIDFKEDKNKFFEDAAKFKSSGPIEVVYKSNDSSPVTMGFPNGTLVQKLLGGDVVAGFHYNETNVRAYNDVVAKDELVMDSSQGQWLITNGIYSRDNPTEYGIFAKNNPNGVGSSITASPLATSPWGLSANGQFIRPEDFLMGLSKAIYGVEQSRPVYIQTTPYRLARKNIWYVWTTPPPPISDCSTHWQYRVDAFKVRDVSQINPDMMDYSPPGCGQSKFMDRGEYITHPDGYLTNLWQRYYPDQNVYVSPNVYELYFTRLLQKGIVTTDEAFAHIDSKTQFVPNRDKASAFSFAKDYGNNFYLEYYGYGENAGSSTKKTVYPAWSPELGALYTNPELRHIPLGHNLTDKDIAVTYSMGKTAYERALGIRYRLTGNNAYGVRQVRLATDDERNKMFVMTRVQVTVIEALRLIERAMRVEQGDMTESEADIITRKYGASYLTKLSDSDRKTVQYLLAKGILNFENHQEYASLNSPLTTTFAYKLIYRVANKEARLEFTKVTLTDNTELPKTFQQVNQTLLTADIGKLSQVGSLAESGGLIKNDNGEPLNLVSDFQFMQKDEKIEAKIDHVIGDRYRIKSTIDDPLKYLYRSMPLVNTTSSGGIKEKFGGGYEVYADDDKKLYNNVNEGEMRYTGIEKVEYDANKERYIVTFLVFADNYNSAVEFIKANLTSRIESVMKKEEEKTVVTKESGVVTENKASDIASQVTNNGDIVGNGEVDLTAYSNNKTSIVGNAVVDGSSTVTIDKSKMTNVNVLPKLVPNVVVDPLDNSKLISMNIPQLNGNMISVFNPKGSIVGKTKVLEKTVTSKVITGPKNMLSTKFEGFDINLLKSADILTKDKVFQYTDSEGVKRNVNGSIVISWKLDLPSLFEQHSLVGNLVSPNLTDISKSTWIFTEPSQTSLKTLWDYNMGLNNALLKTLTGTNIKMPSGYFAPTVDLLIDVNASEYRNGDNTYYKELTAVQVQEIKNSFFNEVASNLPKNWLQMYVGSIALSNYVVGSKDEKGQIPKNVRNQVKTELSTRNYTYIDPQGLLRGMLVPNGQTVWSHIVFNQTKPHEYANTYLENHSHLARFNMYTIFTIDDSIKFYGSADLTKGEGMTQNLNIQYAKDNFENIYKSIPSSDYTFNVGTESMQELTSYFRNDETGSVIKNQNHEQWIVANETEHTYDLFSSKFTPAIYKDGQFVSTTSGNSKAPEITKVIHAANLASFGKITDGSIKSDKFMLTRAFDFTPRKEDIARDTTFIAIRGGKMLPYKYTDVVLEDGSITTKLQSVTVTEGDVVHVPQFVSLYKTVWYISNGVIKWNKTFIGANPESYTKGSLIQLMKETILASNSPNIVMSQDIKGGTVDIGHHTSTIKAKKTVFTITAEPEMVQDTKLNEQAVLDKFNANSDVVILPDGTTASSAQYLTNKKAGDYDPTYEFYDNTLVVHDSKLKVATGTKLVEYTSNTSIKSVGLTAMLMDGVKMLNYGSSREEGNYKVYMYQDIVPSLVVSPFSAGDVPVPDVDDAFVADVAEVFEGLPMALNLFESLDKRLEAAKVNAFWRGLIYSTLGLLFTLSITVLLAHVLYHAPIANIVIQKLQDSSGVDLLAILSAGVVRISDAVEAVTWKRTLKAAFLLGVVPLVILSLAAYFGWS